MIIYNTPQLIQPFCIVPDPLKMKQLKKTHFLAYLGFWVTINSNHSFLVHIDLLAYAATVPHECSMQQTTVRVIFHFCLKSASDCGNHLPKILKIRVSARELKPCFKDQVPTITNFVALLKINQSDDSGCLGSSPQKNDSLKGLVIFEPRQT